MQVREASYIYIYIYIVNDEIICTLMNIEYFDPFLRM